MVGADARLYKYWSKLVGSDNVKLLARKFEYNDGSPVDLPDAKGEQRNDFYDSYVEEFENSINDKKTLRKEFEKRWEDLVNRAKELKHYGPIDRDIVIQHGKTISKRRGEYNDETCK